MHNTIMRQHAVTDVFVFHSSARVDDCRDKRIDGTILEGRQIRSYFMADAIEVVACSAMLHENLLACCSVTSNCH